MGLVSLRCKGESPGLLTSTTLTAIARFTIVHRAILTGLLTARLVCRETHCANRGCQDRKQDFKIIFYTQPSLASITNASQKMKNVPGVASCIGGAGATR